MNLLVFRPEDIGADRQITVKGKRAEHILMIKKLGVGDELPVGELNGNIGTGIVKAVMPDAKQLVIDVKLNPSRVREESKVDLVLALPRPQIIKRVLFTAAMMGVRNLYFTPASKVEKSYFQSSQLTPSNIEENILLGLEQAGHTIAPKVQIYDRFSAFIRDFSNPPSLLVNEGRLLAHPFAERNIAHPSICEMLATCDIVVVAVGPEGGWDTQEIKKLESIGYESVSMGSRILRVDTAVSVLLGQIGLLQSMASLGG
ncbi:MAG: RNA methyltransferase [Deltaproteobacteria bacterium]|nr:RNA methyltransferase [Deltaproteobacteria bacterium]